MLGKNLKIRLDPTCLIACGHLLLENLTEVGETTLTVELALWFDLQFHRLHFKSDLLAADLTGWQFSTQVLASCESKRDLCSSRASSLGGSTGSVIAPKATT